MCVHVYVSISVSVWLKLLGELQQHLAIRRQSEAKTAAARDCAVAEPETAAATATARGTGTATGRGSQQHALTPPVVSRPWGIRNAMQWPAKHLCAAGLAQLGSQLSSYNASSPAAPLPHCPAARLHPPMRLQLSQLPLKRALAFIFYLIFFIFLWLPFFFFFCQHFLHIYCIVL